jgi:hypothetical protein
MSYNPGKTPLERFEEKIVRRKNGCWMFQTRGPKGSYRYGSFRIDMESYSIGAHRAAWILYRGQIPEDTCVLHRCDTPGCVNPRHLFLGSLQDNLADMRAKKRDFRKLSATQLSFLRAIRGPLLLKRAKKIAREWGVNPFYLYMLRQRR